MSAKGLLTKLENLYLTKKWIKLREMLKKRLIPDRGTLISISRVYDVIATTMTTVTIQVVLLTILEYLPVGLGLELGSFCYNGVVDFYCDNFGIFGYFTITEEFANVQKLYSQSNLVFAYLNMFFA